MLCADGDILSKSTFSLALFKSFNIFCPDIPKLNWHNDTVKIHSKLCTHMLRIKKLVCLI